MKFLVAFCTFSVATALAADPNLPLPLWPNGAPGEIASVGEERDTTKPTDGKVAGREVMRIGNVSTPTLTLFRPKAGTENGAAVLVCPGGGYNILAWDLEGTEVCDWLNSIGITGVLLKYRVPKRPGIEKHLPPLQDAQRALGLVRQHAAEWGVDPKRLGILGFSAGGHLAAITSTTGNTRAYPHVDDADDQSCRPDFSVLIYPAYLVVKGEPVTISPELKITPELPPIFIAATQDDAVSAEGSVLFYHALTKAKRPAELHIYPSGGHGYGLRRTERAVTTWPDHATTWMRGLGVLGAKKEDR